MPSVPLNTLILHSVNIVFSLRTQNMAGVCSRLGWIALTKWFTKLLRETTEEVAVLEAGIRASMSARCWRQIMTQR